jgi:hypothetical protein
MTLSLTERLLGKQATKREGVQDGLELLDLIDLASTGIVTGELTNFKLAGLLPPAMFTGDSPESHAGIYLGEWTNTPLFEKWGKSLFGKHEPRITVYLFPDQAQLGIMADRMKTKSAYGDDVDVWFVREGLFSFISRQNIASENYSDPFLYVLDDVVHEIGMILSK